ncbi:MAG TPA: transporter, partial [Gemmataceae bacterium]|nr:transporter [Gemmataceae bacterium]
VVCGLAIAPRLAAQQPTGPSPLSLPSVPSPSAPGAMPPEFADPLFAPDRPGSPVETLEKLTGERARERPQERDEIETDRDSFTPATTTAPRGRLIVEGAYTFIDNRGIKETHSLPELILRYGLTERVELRLGWNYEVGGSSSEVTGADTGEEDPFRTAQKLRREYDLTYGVKIGVTEQRGWVPRSALLLQGTTPTGGSTGVSTASQLITTYVAGWEFSNQWHFDTAFRYATASESGDHFNTWAPSAVLKVPIGQRWAVHGEYFGIFTTGKESNFTKHFFSPGLHCLVTPDLELGFRVGWGLNDQSARFFSNVGFGYRF